MYIHISQFNFNSRQIELKKIKDIFPELVDG